MVEIDTVFFDLDGTLVDARKDIVKAVNYTLRKLGFSERPAEEIISYIGTGTKDLMRNSLGRRNAAYTDKAVSVFSGYYEKHSADESRLYPHVREILEYLEDKRKFILTNRFSRFARLTLEGLGIKDCFEEIIGADDESCRKPSPCLLGNAMTRLKVNKAHALIIGDMAIDIETGKNAGVKTCWVTYGLGKKEDLKGLRPDYVISDISDLEKIVS
jgi:2-phosphoglycolate phosphatase